MRLIELFEQQVQSRSKANDGTVPEVFIIESLSLADEAKERREGAVLASVLKMCGKKPLYYYIRTRVELEYLAKEFENTGYRYLHISCHGGEDSLETTFDSVSYEDFASIFSDRLGSRRLFVSACSAGNDRFAELIYKKNRKLNSVVAPADDIRFDHAVAFWTGFYVKLFSINAKAMNSEKISGVLKSLCVLFSVSIHWSKKRKNGGAIMHEIVTQ